MDDVTTVGPDGLITTEQAAKLCGVKPVTVRQWVTREILPVAGYHKRRILLNVVDVAKAELATRKTARRTPPAGLTWTVEGDPGSDVTAVIMSALALARDAAPGAKSVVYYVRFADRIKIGTSTNLSSRLRGVPHDELLATEPGDWLVEHMRHEQFARYRITGEWFRRGQALLDHIAKLARETPECRVASSGS
jgi:Helix-turn-helix domain